MAVETGHVNLFPPQLITNRDFVKNIQGNGGLYNTQIDSCVPLMDTMQQAQQQLWPMYQSLVSDPIPAKTSMNQDDSGLTYNIPAVTAAPRKRPRENNTFSPGFDAGYPVPQKNTVSPFLDESIFSQIQQEHEQQQINCLISEHTKRLRVEIEERRKMEARMIITAIQERVVKKLKEKDEEIQRIGKLNWFLQEKVKSLSVENQLWREMAQSNEATANSLRNNLEQVLAHVSEERGGAAMDDCESSCGSSDEGVVAEKAVVDGGCGGGARACRKCGEREASVLLLPCRHLCLCTMCGSSLVGTCPVCDSVLNATLHVNMS